MKKVTISISYDEEKLSALKLYLEQKGTQVEDELTNALEVMYSKNVPSGVRDFISMRSGAEPAPPKPKKPRPEKVNPAPAEVSENELS